MEGNSHKHRVNPQENHPPILGSPTPILPPKNPFPQHPSLHTAHLVIEDVPAVPPSFQPHTLPPPLTPAPASPAPTFLSFPSHQASTARPQAGVTQGLPDIKPFIQLGPTASSKRPPPPPQQNSISFAPQRPNFKKVEPVQVFHHGSPLFLSQIRSIQVTSEPPVFLGPSFPTATPRSLHSLSQQRLDQVFGPVSSH